MQRFLQEDLARIDSNQCFCEFMVCCGCRVSHANGKRFKQSNPKQTG